MNTSSENDRGSLDPTLEANKKTVMAYARLSCQDRDQGAARKRLGSPCRCGATGRRIVLLPAFNTAWHVKKRESRD